MGWFSMNGITFACLKEGEKPLPEHAYASSVHSDVRYVIWQEDGLWNVCSVSNKSGKVSFLPLAEQLFKSSDEAWRAAYQHWIDIDRLQGVTRQRAALEVLKSARDAFPTLKG
ncbi:MULTISPECIES: hypothetical protein [unclassified Enterobacter]|uniref:hypothetical protein n=1 Tax=unclassified Enterobacter TaxID=2608935 RepID=UPI0008F22D9F|nr:MULTISPECIES: hypothetical protein [unclassified Enterobacter]SFR13619.1 hypothetical protein SAMN04487773_3200 [Enterobacter sp. kpr-6]